MADSLLIPCSVSAKSVPQAVPVSTLASQPCQTDATLEAGIHIHWALPDALTAAKIDSPTAARQALFPGAPDLWLVVRFNPPSAADSTRKWTAWVVDSISATATPFESWQPPARTVNQIFTAAGVLPVSGLANYAGWGALPSSASYDPLQAAYYPAARNRFGFHDDLAGITPGPNVNVSYTVIGWYSNATFDPLASSATPVELLKSWDLDWQSSISHVRTPVGLAALAAQPAWMPQSLSVTKPAPAAAQPVRQIAVSAAALRQSSAALKNKITAVASSGLTVIDAGLIAELLAPSGIVCHGSVFSVPTAGPSTKQAPLPAGKIAVHPHMKRALAAVSNNSTDPQTLDYAEMMLQGLDAQTGTIAGVLDLPGAAQSLSFQGVPGKPTYFAKIEIGPATLISAVDRGFALLTTADANGTGNWPSLQARSAAIATQRQSSSRAPQPGGTRPDSATWIQQLLTAFHTAVSAASVPVDSRFIYVRDTRSPLANNSTAQPIALGIITNGEGTDQAGWWLDTQDAHALQMLYTNTAGASVSFPEASDLYRAPGPRWYRPWSPQIVLTNAGRSFRFGCDGRFTSNGHLECRTSGDTVSSISINGGPVITGRALLDHPAALQGRSLPVECAPLTEEAALLDSGSAPVMSRVGKQTAPLYAAAQTAIYVSRDASQITAAVQTALNMTAMQGKKPSPIALTPWQDPFDPLFIDAKYRYRDQPIAGNWELQDDYVELTPVQGAAAPASPGVGLAERTRVTATLADTLKSTLVTATTLDPNGNPVRATTPPRGSNNQPLTAKHFDQLNAISAPLVRCDEFISGAGFRERAGQLDIDEIDLVDVFGIRQVYQGTGGISTPLTPRLPYWARLKFRLQSAADPAKEADRGNPPVCGFLVPDYIDHAMDVFDADGAALGQIVSDPPQAVAGGGTLSVSFISLPWLNASGDPTSVIQNPTLRGLVQALLEQTVSIPEKAPSGTTWYETGLTAMMRIIDTIRGTLDPLAKTQDRRVKLIGEPIVVFNARVAIEATLASEPGVLSGDPPPLTTPPDAPAVPFRIGDLTRPDDGVLGLFDAARGKFAPVSMDAANNAILSGLSQPAFITGEITQKVTHPFIEPQQNTATPGGPPIDLVVLADARGGYYATCGALPRKKIVMPTEFIQPVIGKIDAVIQAGPVALMESIDGVQPVVAPPQIEGTTCNFIYAAAAGSYTTVPLPTSLPLADLPPDRITLDAGWIQIVPGPAPK